MGTGTPRITIQQYKSMLQGKINRAQGARFEDLISESCLYYQAEGIAYIEKTSEPMKPIRAMNRQKGTFEAVYTKQGQPDYKGTMMGGRAVCFEAKHTEADRIRQDAVQPHQMAALDLHNAMGALCFILVSMGHRYYRVPWVDWREMKDIFGHKYLNENDIARYEVEKKRGDHVILFLAGI